MSVTRVRVPRALWSAACIAVAACGDNGVGARPPANISGNWYFVDPSAPPATGQLNEIGGAIVFKNGAATGNVSVAISNSNNQCTSFGLNLPITGTVRDGHLSLRATDSVVTFTLRAALGAGDTAFADGSYGAIGIEAYPLFARTQQSCAGPTGKLDGRLMSPVNATYSGTLAIVGGGNVVVTLKMQQDTVPIPPSVGRPTAVPRGVDAFLVGGFSVTGTMQLASPVCGATTIQTGSGYVWGTVLQVEFGTNPVFSIGAIFNTLIDPETGALTMTDASIFNFGGSSTCEVSLTGTLARQ